MGYVNRMFFLPYYVEGAPPPGEFGTPVLCQREAEAFFFFFGVPTVYCFSVCACARVCMCACVLLFSHKIKSFFFRATYSGRRSQ